MQSPAEPTDEMLARGTCKLFAIVTRCERRAQMESHPCAFQRSHSRHIGQERLVAIPAKRVQVAVANRTTEGDRHHWSVGAHGGFQQP
jgi:hypothetical protein